MSRMIVNGKVLKRTCQKAMQTGRDYSRNINNNVILAVYGTADLCQNPAFADLLYPEKIGL